VNDMSSIYSSD